MASSLLLFAAVTLLALCRASQSTTTTPERINAPNNPHPILSLHSFPIRSGYPSRKPSKCCFPDPCSPRKEMCAHRGKSVRDSCHRRYDVSEKCKATLRKKGRKLKIGDKGTRHRSKCCFIDPCNSKKICATRRSVLTTSCGDSFSIDVGCVLGSADGAGSDSCCFKDHCNGMKICAEKQSFVADSCGSTFKFSKKCKLRKRHSGTIAPPTVTTTTRIVTPSTTTRTFPPTTTTTTSVQCCYSDACNGREICAIRGGVLSDSCVREYDVGHDCKLSPRGGGGSECCYTDVCNKKHICAKSGGKLWDSCGRDYSVGKDCRLSQTGGAGQCCYIDACNKKQICANRGGKLWDSCGRDYAVGHDCHLTQTGGFGGGGTGPGECCYKDACNHQRICARKGGHLWDSCKKDYKVGHDCRLH